MSIDIVNLIESNPLTRFSGDYQNKLIEKVKSNFTDYEQQLFLSSFYCYVNHDPYNDFVVDLDDVWKWLDFNQKVKAKALLENNFVKDKDYILCDNRFQQRPSEHKRGGHNKEVFMMNVDTFKRFCMKAGTKKAEEIQTYFIKLEYILFEITSEQCEELKHKLLHMENKNKELEERIFQQKQIEKEKHLLAHFTNAGNIVYVIKVKTHEDGTYVVKIGESRKGIQNRYNEHKSKYEECLLLDCFSVNKSKEFESFIHHHPLIGINKVKNLPNHESENELFLVGKDLTYQMLTKIIEENISHYNYNVNELLLEIENLKLQKNSPAEYNRENNELMKEIIQQNKILSNQVNNLTNIIQQMHHKQNAQETRTTTGFQQQMPHLGPRLQQINPETLLLVKVYESVTEAMNGNKNIKRPSIMKAIAENTIYCGYRWQLVERNLDPNIIHSISPTKITKTQNLGYISKLDENKTRILNVYLDRKTAAIMNEYKSASSLDNAVKNETISNSNYYILYDKCEDDIVEEFENTHGKPLLYKNGVGQFDVNGNLIREFSCKYDVLRTLNMSDKTLTKAMTNNIPYNNVYYRELGEKLSFP